MKSRLLPAALKEKLSLLTEKERGYFKIMWPKSGVLYITAKPGVAKSAIMREIADKLGFAYFDIRLSMIDETDVGLFPDKITVDGKTYLDHIVPLWAHEANERPTIIHWEELNRASAAVRNAALQILLERRIGRDFQFNDMVLMVASGNLGDEDGTDVEEFDGALNNRLIHVKHSLSKDEWLDGYAKENIHPSIYDFIKAKPEYLYKNATNNQNSPKAYATPRSWTFLSDYIVGNYGMEAPMSEFLADLPKIASSYVGESAMPFLQYCQESISISLQDILDRYEDIEFELEKCTRGKHSELLSSLKEENLELLTSTQIENIHKFLALISKDELVGYLASIFDILAIDVDAVNTKALLKRYISLIDDIKNANLRQNKNSTLTKSAIAPKGSIVKKKTIIK